MNLIGKIKDKYQSHTAKMEAEEKEKLLGSSIVAKYRDAKNTKAPTVSLWKACIDAYNGKTNNKYPEYKADHNSNFIFATVETIKPIMTDNEPKFMAIPTLSQFVDVAETIQMAFEYEWRRTKMQSRLSEALTLGLQIGTFIWGVFWEKNASNGLGEVKPQLINPFNLFPDPMATCIEDAQYIIYACYKSIEELKKSFPEKASSLAGGSIKDTDLVMGNSSVEGVKNQVLVLECYWRDYDEFEIVTDQEGNKKKTPKFPKGRITTVTEDGIVLSDKPNPYNDGKFPFVITKNYQKPFEFWGMSEVEQLLKPQHYINDLNNQIIDNARLTGNMPWIIDKNSGIGYGKLTNRPGLVIRKNPGTEVGRMSPPTMPRYIQDKIDELKRDMEIISGIHDITQGRKPGGITAAAAIEALQEAGQARIRLKVRLMEESLSELGEMWFSRMKQFWVTQREIQRLNPDFSYQFADVTPDMLQGQVTFFVVAGSTMPINRASRLQQMISLAQTVGEDGLPMVDRQAVLEVASMPDRDKILSRFAALKQQAMMATQPVPTDPSMMGQEASPQDMMSDQGAQMDPSMMEGQQGQPEQQPQIDPAVEQIIGILSQLSDEQVHALMKEIPELQQVLQQLQ